MTLVLQSLVWIAVMTASGRTQRRYSYLQNPQSITLLSISFMGLIESMGAMDPSSPFELEIPDKCKELGYCERIPNYPVEKAREQIKALGENVRALFTNDKVSDEVQIAKRIGSDGDPGLISLCSTSVQVIAPEALQDQYKQWFLILQDRGNNLTQNFVSERCNDRDAKCSVVTFPNGYESKCVQRFMFRTLLFVDNSDYANFKILAQREFRVPNCCSCTAYPKLLK